MPDSSVGQSERRGIYRYEATIRLVIYADGQDIAWRAARDAAEAARVAGVESADTSMIDLHYRPTVREQWTQHPEPVGADREHTSRGRSDRSG